MTEQKWTMRGEYMESCNCDYLCPCIYTNPQAPVTYDHCTAALVFRIDEGSYGSTKLDGLKFALVIRSGKVMADGNWIFAGVVDERADEAQRQALAAIVGGQAGGSPAFIRENLVSDFRGIAYKPIEFDLEGLKRSTVIPDVLSFEIEGVASRNRSGEPFYIDNTAHPAGRRLALARAKEMHMHGFGLDLDLVGKGNNGHFAPFSLGGISADQPACRHFGEPRQSHRGAAASRSRRHLVGSRRRDRALVALRLSANGCDGGDGGHRHARHIHTLDGQRLRPQHGDLVGDDAGHDAAQRRTDDPDLCDDQPAQAPARPVFCSDNGVHGGLSDRLGAVRHLCDLRGLGARTRCPNCADNGKARPGIGRHRRHCRRYHISSPH